MYSNLFKLCVLKNIDNYLMHQWSVESAVQSEEQKLLKKVEKADPLDISDMEEYFRRISEWTEAASLTKALPYPPENMYFEDTLVNNRTEKLAAHYWKPSGTEKTTVHSFLSSLVKA